ncbi:MAG: hypothetical protein EA359_13390 [Balneolaceae bacterium]|nr:MAG: hypothetical protein EA359_13390 [Balneolaceae bacterium]
MLFLSKSLKIFQTEIAYWINPDAINYTLNNFSLDKFCLLTYIVGESGEKWEIYITLPFTRENLAIQTKEKTSAKLQRAI